MFVWTGGSQGGLLGVSLFLLESAASREQLAGFRDILRLIWSVRL